MNGDVKRRIRATITNFSSFSLSSPRRYNCIFEFRSIFKLSSRSNISIYFFPLPDCDDRIFNFGIELNRDLFKETRWSLLVEFPPEYIYISQIVYTPRPLPPFSRKNKNYRLLASKLNISRVTDYRGNLMSRGCWQPPSPFHPRFSTRSRGTSFIIRKQRSGVPAS